MTNIALYLSMLFIVPIALFAGGYWVSLAISEALTNIFGAKNE
jgi:hypothetical protein